jgi:K+-sensing histidine kinase KdpD
MLVRNRARMKTTASPMPRPMLKIRLIVIQLNVEAHGGRVSVESKEGFGSKFHFTLPRRSDKGATDD